MAAEMTTTENKIRTIDTVVLITESVVLRLLLRRGLIVFFEFLEEESPLSVVFAVAVAVSDGGGDEVPGDDVVVETEDVVDAVE